MISVLITKPTAFVAENLNKGFGMGIYVDFDCVLFDTNKVVLDVIKKEYGEELGYMDLTYFNILPDQYRF